jgi:heme-degrading monooxygenase HmoA
MYARLTFIEIDPKDVKEVSKLYNTQIVQTIRECKGNKDALLLEPTEAAGEFISLTLWNTKEDADEYESSGTYRRMVDIIKNKFVNKPILKTYNVQESKVPAM